MKPQSSCQSCRQRHRRCITRPGATRCNGCDELDHDCNFGPKFQFRPSKQLTRTKTKRKGSHGDVIAQTTVGTSPVEERALTTPPCVPEAEASINGSHGTYSSSPSPGLGPEVENQVTSPQISAASASDSFQDSIPMPNADGDDDGDGDGDDNCESPRSQRQNGPGSAASIVLAQPRLETRPASTSGGRLTRREAFLFRTWVEKIAVLLDGVDDARHFGVTVSRLALEHPVLLNGILALASRFDALATGSGSDIENTYYHSRCIELLIELLSKPAETYDSTILAAVVLSRVYEENDTETDVLTYHLSGTRTLLSNEVITRLATEGGLAEAACWVHLRQAIYVAIVHRQHLNIPLGVYKELTAFRRNDDMSYANRVIYLFAQLLREFFPGNDANANGSSPQFKDTWGTLEQELETWLEAKPPSFEPLYYEPPDTMAGNPFPSTWMVSTVQTVALQHYYAGMIILCLKKCNGSPGNGGFEAARLRRNYEKSVASYLRTLMGLALSNTHALNAWYLPCHMLDLCGYCLQSPIERAQTIQYLEAVRKEIQWKTAPVVTALKRQWAELDGCDS